MSRGKPPNPLQSDDPMQWDRLIEEIGPASMLLAIRMRMGPAIRGRYLEEDVWQDVLLQAWRARRQVEWQGHGAFRRWLLQIAENCLRALFDHDRAQKRGGGVHPRSLAHDTSAAAGPADSTTPSRVAADRELAAHMEQALAALAPEEREVLRLRSFESVSLEETAATLGLSVSAVRHRFRRGVTAFEHRLRELRRQSSFPGADSTTAGP